MSKNDKYQGESVAWETAERTANVPAVHEALQMFSDDPTGDAGTSLVRAVLEAVHADPAEVERLRAELDNSYTVAEHERLVAKGQEINVSCISSLRAQLAEAQSLLARTLPYLSNTPDLVQHGAEDLTAEIRNASAGRPCYGPNEWGTECGQCSKCKSASAEPSALVEIDERAEFDAWFKDHSKDWPFPSESIKSIARDNDWTVWQARAALAHKP